MRSLWGSRKQQGVDIVKDKVVNNLTAFEVLGFSKKDVKDVTCIDLADVWGGMGRVVEVCIQLQNGEEFFAIAKSIRVGECSSVGDRRKRDSYHVEANFLEKGYAESLNSAGARCPLPVLIERSEDGTELFICMTKLEGSSPHRPSHGQLDETMRWLACLHATFWGRRADRAVIDGGLQPQGAYWYLDTRQEELRRMPHSRGWENRLRLAAKGLDARLKADRHQTLVHGDAKTANRLYIGKKPGHVSVGFCDYQYIGKAHPCKDLCYALVNECREGDEIHYLERYLEYLSAMLLEQGDTPPTREELVAAYGLCICDLARWMAGWGWNGFEPIMRKRCLPVLQMIDGGSPLDSEEAYTQAIFSKFPV